MKFLTLLVGTLVATALLVATVFWMSDGSQVVEDLPWQSELDTAGNNVVFGFTVGKTRLREAIEALRSFPETAAFESAEGRQTLEAYFGKKRLGIFEARLVAELDIDEAQLQQFIQQALERKAQPSGSWRYELRETNMLKANDLVVRYLIYMPVTDYDTEVITARFGQATEQHRVNERFSYWFYPDKGLIIFQDLEGNEVFYYTAKAHYTALRERLLSQKLDEASP